LEISLQGMKINTKYTQFKPAVDIEEYAQEHFGQVEHFLKSFEKQGEITMFVEIGRSTKHHKKGDVFFAEAMFETTPGGKTLRATDSQPDIRMAIVSAKEKIKKEVRRYKDKLVESKRRVKK
jgi:ribosome-associated translation inhibitor RaiA